MAVHTKQRTAPQAARPQVRDPSHGAGAATGARLDLMRAWARVGALFNTTPSEEPIDLEELIAETVTVARADERLFVMAASWLAQHHHLVDARRLGRRLDVLDDVSSAVAGAMLSMAAQETSGPTALTAAATHCRPLARPAPGPQVRTASALPCSQPLRDGSLLETRGGSASAFPAARACRGWAA